jgi:hypothetical protein
MLLGARGLLAQFSQRRPSSGMPPFPDPADASGSRSNDPRFPDPNFKWRLKENQKKLRRDADQLLELAKALKEDADKTEEVNVLSLSLVRKAEAIEKLAKQIKGLARTA